MTTADGKGRSMPGGQGSMEIALAASDLTKRFGEREAVSELTLSVSSGRAFGLLGPNGAGKTTTVRLLTGLLTPNEGHVSLFGETLTRSNADSLRARIGVQTDTELYLSLSVRDNLRTWGELYGLSSSAITRRIGEVLDVLDLSSRIDSPVGELSKGMRQKLSVGRAVLHEPELLFLDEPTAGLDPEASAELIAYLKEMIHALHTTVVMCTHQLHGLESLCDEIGILVRGRLVVAGEVSSLLRQRWPQHRYRIGVESDIAAATREVEQATSGTVEKVDERFLRISVASDETISPAVAALVHAGIPISAVIPEVPTIQDLYFATVDDASLA